MNANTRRALRLACGAAVGLLAAVGAMQTEASAATLEVGAGKRFKQPSEAIASASDGDRIVIAPGEYFDCTIIRTNRLTIEGAGASPADVVLTDKVCNGKALFVTNGAELTIRNLTLTRARAPDENGAGIRAQGPSLVVDNVRFINNQMGILATGPRDSSVIVRNSQFERNGTCLKQCGHAIYAGDIGMLRVEASRFLDTKQGHHVKSRAAKTEIVNNTIQDGPEGTASYLVDIPAGGAVLITGNTLAKGPNAENKSAAIVIGAAGVSQPTPQIVVENNQFRNEGSVSTIFVRNMTATEARLKGNRISGLVKPLQGDGAVTN